MSQKRIIIIVFSLIVFSILITLLLANNIGNPLTNFEARIYQKISGKKPQYVKYDKSGLPIVVYEGNVGEHVTVVMASQEALKYYKNIGDTTMQNKFFACIEWLTSNSTKLNDSSIIFYVNFDWPSFSMKKPWRSAMSQGRAMQAFLKAYEFTGDSAYLGYARKSMNTLYTAVKDGGVTYFNSSGYWYEEYADDSVPESRVLNGMIVVLQALSDYYKVTNDPEALLLFNKGVNAVKSTLHLYDTGGHSNYDVMGKPASPWYHNFHIQLLDFLYTETHDSIFNQYKQRWMNYKEPSYLPALINKPTRIGVFAVVTLFVMVLLIVSMITYIIWFRRSKIEKPITNK